MLSKKGNGSIIILGAVALLAISVGAYFYLQTKQPPPTPTPPSAPPVKSSGPITRKIASQSSIAIDRSTGWKIYTSNKYSYSLRFPQDWRLNEQVISQDNDNVNVYLSNDGDKGFVALMGSPIGIGCQFMTGPNPNLKPRVFEIGGKTITLKDDCSANLYTAVVKTVSSKEIPLKITVADDQNYKTVQKVLDSFTGLVLITH